jgi:RHS repeat-associated protein
MRSSVPRATLVARPSSFPRLQACLRRAASYVGALLLASFALPGLAQDAGREWIPFEAPDATAAQATPTLAKPKSPGGTTMGTTAFSATGKNPWDEYDKAIQASGVIGTLGPDLFGDTVEYYKNTLSFSVTDISLPGNFPLPVALTRKMTVNDRYAYDGIHDEPMQDWDLDIPGISGVYAPAWGDDRCSFTVAPQPPAASGYETRDFWNGLNANMPGGGELLRPIVYDPAKPERKAAPKPSNGVAYPWMTSGLTYIRCVTDAPAQAGVPAVDAVGNATGEGFEALTTDGTKYTFGWMATNYQPRSARPAKTNDLGEKFGYAPLERRLNTMYVTRIEDRFGNTVTYTYDNAATEPVRLRKIEASDGRLITFEYSGGTLTSASAHGRTWNYQYALGSLAAVILPDGSRWTYDFSGLAYAVIEPDLDPTTQRNCNSNSQFIGGGGTGTVTHPSGAVGTFTVAPARHGRSNVPKFCDNWAYTNNNPNDDVQVVPRAYTVLSISRKQVSGPGLVPFEWVYSGGSLASWTLAANDPDYVPVCQSANCMEPVCVADSCAGQHVTAIVGQEIRPDGTRVVRDFQRITFGNSYRYNEGKLLMVERGANSSAGAILEVETYTYNLAQAGQAFATPIGRSLQERSAGFASEYVRPQKSKAILRDGVDFKAETIEYDEFLRSPVVDRYSRVAATSADLYRKRETTGYHDNTAAWVLGQVGTLSSAANGGSQVVSETIFDAKDRPQQLKSFGQLQQTLGYDDTPGVGGTLATVTDGNANVTTLWDWKRGVPREMRLPDNTRTSALVNDAGWITQVTDELGTVTDYGYDAMGRLALVDYTNADTVAWNSTNRSFGPMPATDYDLYKLPAGSWKQVAWTGNGRTSTWYNARWQPVLVLTEDTTNPATRSFVETRYDALGRVAFKSYPVAALTAVNNPALKGTRTSYDSLGRVTRVEQDAESTFAGGIVATTTTYSTPFRTTVTNPRLFSTTTEYQAYDTPSTDAPVKITAPETQTTTIVRDQFLKPLSITRSGTWSGAAISATRQYVYDASQQLCLQIEPESGTTVLAYDGAGNVSWSATGQTATSCTDRAALSASIADNEKTRRTYDKLNRIRVVDVPGTAYDPTYTYYPDGALRSLVNNNVTWEYDYNLRRLPKTEKLTFGGRVRTLTHAYNANAHELSLTYPSGLVVNHSPNALGQPSRAGNFATAVTYFPNGGMSGFTYGACAGADCIVHAMEQNERQLPRLSRDKRANDDAVIEDTYTYDANGNVAAIDGGIRLRRTRSDLLYDGLDRLLQVKAPGTSWIDNTFEYDPLDNLRTNLFDANGGAHAKLQTYQYNADRNRLASLQKPASTPVEHDVRGNVTSNGVDAFVFDAANRLTRVCGIGEPVGCPGGGKESYAYDGHGRRVWMNRLGDNKAAFPMYSLAGQLITEEDNRSDQATDYVYLNGSLVAKRSRPVASGAWTTTYLHTDALGSPVAETNALAQLQRTRDLTPYGVNSATFVGEPLVQGPEFTGHVTDAATGLVYMQQRYYDPVIGRFLSVDPVSSRSTGDNSNRYFYAKDNPYRFTDPDGRETDPVAGDAQIQDSEIRTNASNPMVGRFGDTRSTNNGNGGFHNGLDRTAPNGTPLRAPISGVVRVVDARNNPRGGNVIKITKRENGHTVVVGMAHLNSVSVRQGETVTEGQSAVGIAGSTGNARGMPAAEQHVHITVRVDGRLVDPQAYFRDHPPARTDVVDERNRQ